MERRRCWGIADFKEDEKARVSAERGAGRMEERSRS